MMVHARGWPLCYHAVYHPCGTVVLRCLCFVSRIGCGGGWDAALRAVCLSVRRICIHV